MVAKKQSRLKENLIFIVKYAAMTTVKIASRKNRIKNSGHIARKEINFRLLLNPLTKLDAMVVIKKSKSRKSIFIVIVVKMIGAATVCIRLKGLIVKKVTKWSCCVIQVPKTMEVVHVVMIVKELSRLKENLIYIVDNAKLTTAKIAQF